MFWQPFLALNWPAPAPSGPAEFANYFAERLNANFLGIDLIPPEYRGIPRNFSKFFGLPSDFECEIPILLEREYSSPASVQIRNYFG